MKVHLFGDWEKMSYAAKRQVLERNIASLKYSTKFLERSLNRLEAYLNSQSKQGMSSANGRG